MKMHNKHIRFISALLLACLCLLSLSSCFHNHWDFPEREEQDFDIGDILQSIVSLPADFTIPPDLSLPPVTLPPDSTDSPETSEGPASDPEDTLIFTLSDDRSYYILSDGTKYRMKTLEVPAQYKSKPVKEIGTGAFMNNEYISEITLPKSVLYIGERAFYRCNELVGVTFSEGLEHIGKEAFKESSMTKLVIPDSVTYIGEAAFESCPMLKSVVIGDGVAIIPNMAFDYCQSLESVEFGRSVETLASGAFFDCILLKDTNLKDSSVRRIEELAFYNNIALEEAVLPDTIEFIAHMAFDNCSEKVFSVYEEQYYLGTEDHPYEWLVDFQSDYPKHCVLHPETRRISQGLFAAYTGVTSMVMGGEGKYIYTKKNCAIEKATNTVISGTRDADIPDDGSVAAIGDYAFYRMKYIDVSALATGKIKSIGKYAFSGCSSVSVRGLSLDVETVGDYAFANSEVNVLYMGGKVKSIGNYAFAETNIQSLTLLETLTEIGRGAFSDCASLKTVTFDAVCEEIAPMMFENCTSLEYIYLQPRLKRIGSQAFYNCEAIQSINLPSDLEYIGNLAFMGCRALLNVSLPDNVYEIGRSAFAGCTALKTFSINRNIKVIGNNALYNIPQTCSVLYANSRQRFEKVEGYKSFLEYLNSRGMSLQCLSAQ